MLDWWYIYRSEPWGEDRADLRQMAGLGLQAGVSGVFGDWPYWNSETAEDVRREFEELDALWEEVERKRHGNSGKD